MRIFRATTRKHKPQAPKRPHRPPPRAFRAPTTQCHPSEKVRFASQEDAVAALVHAALVRARPDEHVRDYHRHEVHAYRCGTCYGWHLTSKPDRLAAIQRARVANRRPGINFVPGPTPTRTWAAMMAMAEIGAQSAESDLSAQQDPRPGFTYVRPTPSPALAAMRDMARAATRAFALAPHEVSEPVPLRLAA